MNEIKSMLFGNMLGDGWISVTGNAGFSGDPESLEVIKSDLVSLYGNIGAANIYTDETSSPKYGIEGITSKLYINLATKDEFIKLGMPTGKKVEVDYEIPKWIMNGSKKVKKGFLSGLYAAEGYTPHFQTNGKTLKPLGLTLTKRMTKKDNFLLFMEQLQKILEDLGIEHEVKTKTTFTVEENIRVDIVFSNNLDNIIRCCKLLNLKYCKHKQTLIEQVLDYHLLKKKELKRLQVAYDDVVLNNLSPTIAAKMYKITRSQAENWRKRKTGVRIPNTFPTFNSLLSCGPL